MREAYLTQKGPKPMSRVPDEVWVLYRYNEGDGPPILDASFSTQSGAVKEMREMALEMKDGDESMFTIYVNRDRVYCVFEDEDGFILEAVPLILHRA